MGEREDGHERKDSTEEAASERRGLSKEFP